MKSAKKAVVVRLLGGVVLCAFLLVGFAGGSQAEQGVTLRIMSYPGPDTRALTQLAPIFEKKTGIKIDIELQPYEVLMAKMLTELLRPTGRYDLMRSVPSLVFDYGFELEPLDDYLTEEVKKAREDVFPVAKGYGTIRGRVYSIEPLVNVRILYYRKDLLEQAGVKVPESWDEFLETAKRFTRPGENLYGVATPLKRGKPVWEAWMEHFFSFGGEFFDKTWHAPVNSPSGIKALEAMRETIKYGPPGIVTYAYKESGEAMCKKLVALQINWISRAWMVSDPEISEVVGKVGYASLPFYDRPKGPISWDGGVELMVPANSPHKEEAAKFAFWTIEKDINKQLALLTGMAPTRISVLQDPEVLERWEYLGGCMDPLLKGIVNPVFQVYGGTEMYGVMAAYLSDALTSDEPAKQALDKIRKGIEEILKGQKYLE